MTNLIVCTVGGALISIGFGRQGFGVIGIWFLLNVTLSHCVVMT